MRLLWTWPARPDIDIPGFDREFDREMSRLLHERSKILQWTVLALYPGFWFLDLLVVPQYGSLFLAIRLVPTAMCAIGLLAVYSRYGDRLAAPAIFINAFACAVGISIMSARIHGFSSNYFVGIIIVIFAIGYFMPWRVRVSVALCAAIIVSYVAINAVVDGLHRDMIQPVYFLLGTAAFTAIANYAGLQTLRRDLSLRLQLEQANAELTELDEAKTRFFANVSHELRTPLTLLLGPIETLRSSLRDLGHGSLLNSMKTNATRLLRQVDALLDIAKIEAGSLRLESTSASIGELLDEVVTSARPLAERKGLVLETKGLAEVGESVFDWEKVWVIAGNLISNAVKFTLEGRVLVRAFDTRDQVVFEVEDTGPGIPTNQLEKVFDRFYQVDSSLSRAHQGTGVGLALARELARLHGGELSVSSELGQGAIFRCELPLDPRGQEERRRAPRRREDRLARARTHALAAREYQRARTETLLADIETPQLAAPSQSSGATPADAATVLLVDDNEDLRNYLAQELTTRYRIRTARDGVQALEVLQREPVDLVVSDVMMPRMDGQTLCRHIREDKAYEGLPIILVTAKAGSEAVIEGLTLGADDYVIKPFVVNELEARIAAHLRRRRAEKQLGERDTRLAAIGQMTSAVAHDLRNALTIVKGYAELADLIAAEDARSALLSDPLKQIRGAVDRLTRMTGEILDYARGGTPHLEKRVRPVRSFLEQTLEPLRTDLKRRGVELSLALALDPETTGEFDADALARVLENLITNSRDVLAKVEGERRVVIDAHGECETLVLRVSDTGPGIPPELERSLFEPFQSGRRSTGLGLATVRNLIKAHGGEIAVEPRGQEGGACFVVRLPILVPMTAAVAGAREKEG